MCVRYTNAEHLGAMKLDSPKILETKIDEPRHIIYVVSYPNSGRTWLRAMLSRYKQLLIGMDDFHIKLHAFHTNDPYSPQYIFYHAGSGDIPPAPSLLGKLTRKQAGFSFDVSACNESRAIVLVRSPKDVLISSYHEMGTRQHLFKGDLAEFIRDERFGLQRWISFHNFLRAEWGHQERVLMVDFASLRRQTAAELQRIFSFSDMEVQASLIEQAVEFSSLDNMRKLELQNQLIRPVHADGANDADKLKVRQGSVGGWRGKLAPADIDYIDKKLRAELSSFYLDGRFADWF
jgi:hypothetical protein